MKSQQLKKRQEVEALRTAAVREARDNDPHLMALYLAFLPIGVKRGPAKFNTDKYGNRVRTAEVSV